MTALTQFHFLRPEWLWALLPLVLLLGILWRRSRSGSGWSSVIDAELLPHLLEQRLAKQQRWPLLALSVAWLASAIAMAGPSWQQTPQPVQKKQDALVIMLDLSLSMLARDITPSRLARSRHKLLDLLEQRKEGVTALVAWAGDAHIVSPLTDDVDTISNLLPALDPAIMPVPGSNPELAVREALGLLHSAGVRSGQLLLVSDGIRDSDISAISKLLDSGEFRLSVIGVGTGEGSPIPMKKGTYLKDRQGEIVIAGLDRSPLRSLASTNGGIYADLTLDDSDLRQVLQSELEPEMGDGWLQGREVDTWHDAGFWLLLLVLPVCLAAFRRGWVVGVVLLLGLPAEQSQAFEWQQLWLTPDQRGSRLLQEGDADQAAETFKNPEWAGTAHYRAGDYESAEQAFASGDSPDHWYNRGNALARAGQLDEAIAAYNKALERNPEMEDALFNRDVVEQLKQQQQNQQQNQQGESGEQNQQQQSGDQQQQDSQADQQSQQNQKNQQQQEGQQGQQGQQQGQQQQGQQQQDQTADSDRQQPQGEEKSDNSEQQSAEAEEAEGHEKDDGEPAELPPSGQQRPLTEEEQERLQATEQWLRRIPDDPSGLLRRKFQYESQQRAAERRNNDEDYW